MNKQTGNDSIFGSRLHVALLLVILALGAGVRLWRMDDPPRDFWTIRQYHNAATARAMFYEGNPSVPAALKEVAARHKLWLAEPPVLEYVVSRVYRLMGEERFWVARLFIGLAWMLGSVCLVLLARRMLSPDAALVAAGFYLLMPYSITASRSWQPDPLMVSGVIATVFFTYRYFESRSPLRLLVAGLAASITTFLKPGGSILTLCGVFGALSWHERGFRRTLLGSPAWIFAILAVLPSLVAVSVAARLGLYEPGRHLMSYISPRMLLTFFFWKGWLGILVQILTWPGLILALLGFAVFPRGRPLALAAGYAAGYAVFSLLCTFTTPNHDYWHLQLLPLAALCVGAGSELLWTRLRGSMHAAWAKFAIPAAGVIFVLAVSLRTPCLSAPPPSQQRYIRMAREIGEAVGHSTRVITLDYDFSKSLRYFAEISGPIWPETAVMEYDRATGKDRGSRGEPQWNTFDLSAPERFRLFYARRNPEYFVVARLLRELEDQPGLGAFLRENFRVLDKGERYIIFDLRTAAERGSN